MPAVCLPALAAAILRLRLEVSVLPTLSHPHSLPSGAIGRLAAPGRVDLCAWCTRRVSDDCTPPGAPHLADLYLGTVSRIGL